MGKGSSDGWQGLRIIEEGSIGPGIDMESITGSMIKGSALEVLSKIKTSSIDMVFLDPPYFLQLPRKDLIRWNQNNVVVAVRDSWDSFTSFEEYDEFIQRTLKEVKRILKPSGTLWVISTYHSLFRIGKAMQDLGFWILNDIHWVKTNPMPNWLGVRFTNATETLLWALRDKDGKGYTFNRDAAKELGVGKVGANIWVLPICTGNERLKGSDGKRLHSTQKPIELLRRVILTSTSEGDIVLDPFAGTGTTGYAAAALGRRFVMVELDGNYVKGAMERFSKPPIVRTYQNEDLIRIEDPNDIDR
ncbi:MAG: DNA-methyltransferase [Thermoplasmatota archaeon]